MLNPGPDTTAEAARHASVPAPVSDLAEQRVALRSLRYQLRTGRADLLAIAEALRIEPVWLNDHTDPESHHRTVTIAEGNRIVQAALALEAAASADPESAEAAADAAAAEAELVRARLERPGYIYLAQLEPKESPLRIKVGFTDDPPSRLNGHRCSAPYTRYLAIWPAKAAWEIAARDAICAGCELIRGEVYLADSLEAARLRGEALFATLPAPPTVPRLVILPPRPPSPHHTPAPSAIAPVHARPAAVAPACRTPRVEAARPAPVSPGRCVFPLGAARGTGAGVPPRASSAATGTTAEARPLETVPFNTSPAQRPKTNPPGDNPARPPP